MNKGIIPPLPPTLGFRVLKLLLLYGFIVGLLLVGLGFALRYQQLRSAEAHSAAQLQLERETRQADAARRETERLDRLQEDERNRKARLDRLRNTAKLLHAELLANLSTANELKKNTETLLSLMLQVASVLREPRLPLLAAFFPAENLEKSPSDTALELARKAVHAVSQTPLSEDPLERRRFGAALKLIAGTIDRTVDTVASLGDAKGVRYVPRTEIWTNNQSVLREIVDVDTAEFQRSYSALASLRSNYDVIVARVSDYLRSIREFAELTGSLPAEDVVVKVLTSERLAFQLATTYGRQLATNIATLGRLSRSSAVSLRVGRPSS